MTPRNKKLPFALLLLTAVCHLLLPLLLLPLALLVHMVRPSSLVLLLLSSPFSLSSPPLLLIFVIHVVVVVDMVFVMCTLVDCVAATSNIPCNMILVGIVVLCCHCNFFLPLLLLLLDLVKICYGKPCIFVASSLLPCCCCGSCSYCCSAPSSE